MTVLTPLSYRIGTCPYCPIKHGKRIWVDCKICDDGTVIYVLTRDSYRIFKNNPAGIQAARRVLPAYKGLSIAPAEPEPSDDTPFIAIAHAW